jgi:hypothetical protein
MGVKFQVVRSGLNAIGIVSAMLYLNARRNNRGGVNTGHDPTLPFHMPKL